MPAQPPPRKRRRVAPLVLGLSLAALSLKLAGCLINPIPPNPHDAADGDPPGDPPDAATDADASEDPG